MKKLLHALAFGVVALAQSHVAQAQVSSYNEATRQLTLRAVSVGNVMFPNVVLRLDDFVVQVADGAVAVASGNLGSATYNEARKWLTLPNVVVGNVMFPSVALQLRSFAILAAGDGTAIALPSQAVSVPTTCTSAGINQAKYNAIAYGMTMDQVRTLLNCAPTDSKTQRLSASSLYIWETSAADIRVFFNAAGTVVQDTVQFGSGFKTTTGTLP